MYPRPPPPRVPLCSASDWGRSLTRCLSPHHTGQHPWPAHRRWCKVSLQQHRIMYTLPLKRDQYPINCMEPEIFFHLLDTFDTRQQHLFCKPINVYSRIPELTQVYLSLMKFIGLPCLVHCSCYIRFFTFFKLLLQIHCFCPTST